MADISILSRLINGIQRNVDLSANTLVVGSLKISTTELTQAILNRLISLQNGTDVDATYHTHDGRYFTETELGSSSASSGSDLIGDDNTYSNFTPTAATVKGALAGIDTALANGDGKVKVSATDTTSQYLAASIPVDNGTNSTNPLESTILNPGANETYRIRFDQSKIDHGSIAGLGDDDHTIYIKADGTRAFTGNQSLGGFKITSLANGTSSMDAVNYSQLQAVQSLVTNFEWQTSVKDKDLTAPPGSPVTGDRYLIGLDQTAGTATGAWAGRDGDIAEWSGTAWTFVEPTLGTYVAIDDENDGLYLFGGTTWTKKYFEATTASTGLVKVGFDIRLDSSAAGNGLGFASGVLSVNVDDSTVEINSDTVRVKDLGITTAKIADSAVTTTKIADNNVTTAKIADNNVTTVKIADNNVTEAKLATSVAGAGLTGGGGSALSVTYSPKIMKSMVAGEAMAANTSFLVRMAINGETAGRVYKADKDASVSDKFYAMGIALKTSAVSAGGSIDVIMMGTHTLGSSDSNFSASNIGKAVYLTAAGAFSVTPPTTVNEAVWRIGIVEDVDKILVGGQGLNGIN